MKKKLVSLLALSCTLAMTLGMTAFAADSVTSTTTTITEAELTAEATAVAAATDCSLDGVEVVVTATTVAVYEEIAAVVESATEIAKIATSLSTAEAKTADLVAVVDVTLEGNYTATELAAGVTVTLTIPDYSSKLGYTLLHCVNGTWEEVEGVSFADGKISGVFYSFSPVAIVSYEIEEETASPSTGDAMPFAVAVAGLGVVAVVASKKRAAL